MAKHARADWHKDNPWKDENLGHTPDNYEVSMGVDWELDRRADERYQRERALSRPIQAPVRALAHVDPDRAWSQADICEAAAHVLAAAAGRPARDPHPLAAKLDSDDRPRLADFLLSAHLAAGLRPESGFDAKYPATVTALGSVSRNLGEIIATAYNGVVQATFDECSADLKSITKPVTAVDFKPVNFVTVDAAALPRILEGGGIETGNLFGMSETVQAYSHGVNLLVSRQTVINDQLDILAAGIEALAVATARDESRQAIQLLEDNPNLDDGQPVFSTAAGNLLQTSPLTAENLDAAIAACRKRPSASGTESNATPAFLVVPSDLEGLARRLVRDIDGALSVISVPWLNATGNYYVLPLATSWPVLVRAVPTFAPNGLYIDALAYPPPADQMWTVDENGDRILPPGGFSAVGAVRVRRESGYQIVSRFGVRCEPA